MISEDLVKAAQEVEAMLVEPTHLLRIGTTAFLYCENREAYPKWTTKIRSTTCPKCRSAWDKVNPPLVGPK